MKKYASLLSWIVSFQLVGFVIGFLMRSSSDGWYETLQVSSLTPPDYWFGIVWTLLYVMLAVSGWLLWQGSMRFDLLLLRIVFVVQMLCNWAWTPIFFRAHWTGMSFLLIVAMIALTSFLIVGCFQKKKTWSAILLIPYLAWISLAAYLNYYIYLYN